MNRYIPSASLLSLVAAVQIAAAGPMLYVGDSNGKLARVDVQSGAVTLLGSMATPLTDIAFAPNGDLYGIDESDFYRVNPGNAALTFIGSHGISGANALGFGPDGTLYAAGQNTASLFRINPVTGQSVVLGNMGFRSAGDFAFNAGELYLSSLQHQLIRINQSTFVGTAMGDFGVSGVLGLATAEDGMLYGVAGTRIFSINTATGAAIEAVDFRGQGISGGWGATVVPEPSACGMLALGGALAFWRLRGKRPKACK